MSCIGSLQPPNYIPARGVHGDLYLGIIMVMMTKCLPYKQRTYTGGLQPARYSCNGGKSNKAATRSRLLDSFTSTFIDPRAPIPTDIIKKNMEEGCFSSCRFLVHRVADI